MQPDETAECLAGKGIRVTPCLGVESGDRFGHYWIVVKRFIIDLFLFNKWSDSSVCKNLRDLSGVLGVHQDLRKGK